MFQDLKLRKKYRFITYRLSDDNRTIIIEKACTDKDFKYDDFAAGLPDDDCRYAVYDFDYQKGDEGIRRSYLGY